MSCLLETAQRFWRGAFGGRDVVLLVCDYPDTSSRQTVGRLLHIRGWAAALSGISGVELRFDDRSAVTADYGFYRPDVHALHGRFRDSGFSGFRCRWDTTGLPEGPHQVRIVARASSGRRTELICEVVVDHSIPSSGPEEEGEVGDGGERVTPECPNDIFVAHLSIYHFAAGFTEGKAVLDAGCGAGYGSHYLLHTGKARHVEGVDVSPKAIAYCQNRYAAPGLHFSLGRVEGLRFEPGQFDVIFCSNVLEHVEQLDETLASLTRVLSPEGRMLACVPCIATEQQLRLNFCNPYHLNNLHPRQWRAKLERFFEQVDIYHHGVLPGVQPDGASGEHSIYSPTDFVFTAVPVDRFNEVLATSISLAAVASNPRSRPLPPSPGELEFPVNWDIEALWRATEYDRRKAFGLTAAVSRYDDAALRQKVHPLAKLAGSRAVGDGRGDWNSPQPC